MCLRCGRTDRPVIPPHTSSLDLGCPGLQAGDSFDLSTVLCSLLIGAGFDAYVVAGYAPQAITFNDQAATQCPALEQEAPVQPPASPKRKVERLKSTKSQGEPKYSIKSGAKLESKFLQVSLWADLEMLLCLHGGHLNKLQRSLMQRLLEHLLVLAAVLRLFSSSATATESACHPFHCWDWASSEVSATLQDQKAARQQQQQPAAAGASAEANSTPRTDTGAAAPAAAAPAPRGANNKLVHAWVLVMAGRRQVRVCSSKCCRRQLSVQVLGLKIHLMHVLPLNLETAVLTAELTALLTCLTQGNMLVLDVLVTAIAACAVCCTYCDCSCVCVHCAQQTFLQGRV